MFWHGNGYYTVNGMKLHFASLRLKKESNRKGKMSNLTPFTVSALNRTTAATP